MEFPKHFCPWCGKECNRVAEFRSKVQHQPDPGDITICFGCGGVAMFNEELVPCKMSKEVWNQIPFEEQMQVMDAQARLGKSSNRYAETV